MGADVACPLLALTPLPTNTHFNRVLEIFYCGMPPLLSRSDARARISNFFSFSKSVKLLIRALKRGLSSPEL